MDCYVTSGILIGLSDVTVQYLLSSKEESMQYNPIRTLIISIFYGSMTSAPVLHFVTTRWAKILPSQSLKAVTLKSVVDMASSFPFNLSVMIGIQSLIRTRGDINQVVVRYNLWPSLLDGWTFWFTASMVIYGFVPLHYRVGMLNVCSYFWNVWLIWRYNAKNENVEVKKEELLGGDVGIGD